MVLHSWYPLGLRPRFLVHYEAPRLNSSSFAHLSLPSPWPFFPLLYLFFLIFLPFNLSLPGVLLFSKNHTALMRNTA